MKHYILIHQTYQKFQHISGAAELGMPGVHVHPLFFEQKEPKICLEFCLFSRPISVVHLAPPLHFEKNQFQNQEINT